MNTAVLTIGPQHIGKSTFCKKVIDINPSIELVSRDQILIDLFGSPYLDSYTGGHFIATEKMWKVMDEKVQEKELIILDCWNGPDVERISIIKMLRERNVKTIGAWYFHTPREIFKKWRMDHILSQPPKKDAKWEKIRQETGIATDLECFDFFYKYAKVDKSKGFDFVKKINPIEPFNIAELFTELKPA